MQGAWIGSLIPGGEMKILHVVWYSQKKKKNNFVSVFMEEYWCVVFLCYFSGFGVKSVLKSQCGTSYCVYFKESKLLAIAGAIRDRDLILGLERSPREGHGNLLQYCWGIPWTGEPGRRQSIPSQSTGHNWSDLACMHDITVCIVKCFFFNFLEEFI